MINLLSYVFKYNSCVRRFDQVSEDIDNKKVDPTLRKYENPGANVIQMLLAAKEGDVGFLRRYYRVNDITINPIQKNITRI